MALLDKFRDQLDAALAGAQAEVGQFLMQKQRILSLPSSLSKQSLLNENAVIQERATKLIGEGTALKTRVDAFDTLDFRSYGRIPSMTHDAGVLAASLAALRADMQAHTARVDSAASSNPHAYPPPHQPFYQPAFSPHQQRRRRRGWSYGPSGKAGGENNMAYRLMVGTDFDKHGALVAVALAGIVDSDEPTVEDVRNTLDDFGLYDAPLEDADAFTLKPMEPFGWQVLENGELMGLLILDVEGWNDEE